MHQHVLYATLQGDSRRWAPTACSLHLECDYTAVLMKALYTKTNLWAGHGMDQVKIFKHASALRRPRKHV